MKEILESIILNIVDNTQAVSIEEKAIDDKVVYEVKVSKEDMGRVIGRQGRVAKAIRILMKSIGAKEKKKAIVEFVE